MGDETEVTETDTKKVTETEHEKVVEQEKNDESDTSND